MKNIAKIVLKPGKEKSVLKKHPWVFSGAIQRDPAKFVNGMVVSVFSATGDFLAFGSYSHHSQIRIRLLSFDQEAFPDDTFIVDKIEESILLRKKLLPEKEGNAYRLIHSEADGLPGLIVDHYANYLVCQFLAVGMEFFRETIINALTRLFPEHALYERSDTESRKKEGLEPVKQLIKGTLPSEPILIQEGDYALWVDLINGHKTGFYLDQRNNRFLVQEMSKNRKVLNCFSYTGGFGVAAGVGGALSVMNIDSSEPALVLGRKNARHHQLENCLSFEKGDVFEKLRVYAEAPEFDLIVLDPPKFAHSLMQVQQAARGYKDINRLAIKALKKDGLLFTYSCSGHMDEGLFKKIIASAAEEAGREVHFLRTLQQSWDHPVIGSFPESLYLKGFLLYVK